MEKLFDDIQKDRRIQASYELVRQIRLTFNVGSATYFPSVEVKIWRMQTPMVPKPYWFDLSHYPQSPTQAEPYRHSNETTYANEIDVVNAVTQLFSMPFAMAVRAGNPPSERWLLPNKNY